MILLCAEGFPSKEVAAQLGVHEHTVGKGSVANFAARRNDSCCWRQLSSEGGELLECGLAGRLELSFADHVGDFDTFECGRG